MVISEFDLLTHDVLRWVEFGDGRDCEFAQSRYRENQHVRHAKIVALRGLSRFIWRRKHSSISTVKGLLFGCLDDEGAK